MCIDHLIRWSFTWLIMTVSGGNEAGLSEERKAERFRKPTPVEIPSSATWQKPVGTHNNNNKNNNNNTRTTTAFRKHYLNVLTAFDLELHFCGGSSTGGGGRREWIERFGESDATHDSQSASRSRVAAHSVERNLNTTDNSQGWVRCPSGLASLHHLRLSTCTVFGRSSCLP